MEFQTLDEALDNRVLCGTCGRPKKELVGIYTEGKVRYKVIRCKKFRCSVHCGSGVKCLNAPISAPKGPDDSQP